jgi:GT2 family glycosyltransferase
MNVEILVYDNASTDDSVALARSFPGIAITTGKRNCGFAHGVNRLFLQAGARDLLLLNPDVQVMTPTPVIELLTSLEDGCVGVAAPRLLNADGSIQASVRRFPTLLGMAGRSTPLKRVPTVRRRAEAYVAVPGTARTQFVDWAIGAALLIRNAAYRRVGGWDERFFLYLEDVDFCLRLATAGYRTVYVPGATLLHTHHRASDTARGAWFRSRARRHHIGSTIKFFAKYNSLAPRPG